MVSSKAGKFRSPSRGLIVWGCVEMMVLPWKPGQCNKQFLFLEEMFMQTKEDCHEIILNNLMEFMHKIKIRQP